MPDIVLAKPAIGVPCNACGFCCRVRVCSAGSFAMKLVARYGERVDGPCAALHYHDDGRQTCGLVERPKDFIPDNLKSVTALREAVKLLIGSGAGCDDSGDEPDATALPKLRALAEEYVRSRGQNALAKAAAVLGAKA